MSVAEYFDNLAKHGRTYQASDAGSREALVARWDVMADALEDGTILQVGCGHGDFADYVGHPHYTGIEISPHSAQMAQDAGHHVICMDVLDVKRGEWDYVVGQGLFYKQKDYETCEKILAKMWELATKAVVVTTILDGQGLDELWLGLPKLLEWVEMLGCEKWTLRHDYLPNDVCLYLYK